MKSPGLCLLSCTALRGSDGFTAAVSIRQRPLDESKKDVLSSIAKLENDSNHASEEIGMFNRLTAIGEDVSLIRETLLVSKESRFQNSISD